MLRPQTVLEFEPRWEQLKEGVRKIITLQVEGVQAMPMMEEVYRLCTAQPKPFSEKLYYALRTFMTEQVQLMATALLNNDGDVLGDYRTKWETYRMGISYLSQIFRYLNLNWIRKTLEDGRNRLGGLFQNNDAASNTKDVFDIYTLGLVVWRDLVFAPQKDRLVTRVLELVTHERDGEVVDGKVMKAVVESLVQMGAVNKPKPLELYKEHFENAFVAETKAYYMVESQYFIDRNGVSAYMRKAELRIEEEEQRARRYLDKSSLDRARKEVDAVLIDSKRELLQIECHEYLERSTAQGKELSDVADLRRMYSLLSRILEGVEPMLAVLRKYIIAFVQEKLAALEKKADQPQEFCEVLLESYGTFSNIVEKAFQSDVKFVQTLDKALREVINKRADAPELLAKYCDALLRKGKNRPEGDDLDGKLRSLITVFKYLDDKDIFQKFYSKYLARRLIYGTSVSDDSEAGVLSSLKQACGYDYTSKLQRMFTDMTVCEDVNSKFTEFLAQQKATGGGGGVSTHGVAFTIMVLTQGSWPLQVHKSGFTAPAEMRLCQEAFGKFYDSVHQGRKLVWLHHLGKADVRANHLKKRYTITVTDFQCVMLLQYNDMERPHVTWEEFVAASNMQEAEVAKTLASLVASKLIARRGDTEEDGPGAQYALNTAYANKHLKFKITAAVQGETEKEKKKTYKQVDDDRCLFLQALIVRTMKMRKRLTHNELLQEVVKQASSRFQPSVQLVKKQIETLIEKEYIAREEGGGSSSMSYNYVA